MATGVIYIGSGIQSYSTTDVGNNSYALEGESLSLADAGALYTIDELDTDDAEIIDDNEGRTEDSFGVFDSSDSISADEDCDLAIQAIGSLTHAGTDSATSYSDDLEYSGSGGSDWQYDNFDNGDNNSGCGGGSYESDVDLDGTDSSDGDSGQDISVTFGSDSSSEWDAGATETGASVNFGFGLVNDPYNINTDDGGAVADSATGMSMNEDGEFDYSETRIDQENASNNEAGSEAEDPTDWTSKAGLVQDFTLFITSDNDGGSTSGSGNDGTEHGSGVFEDDIGGPILAQSHSGVHLGTSDLLETLDQRLTVTLPTTSPGVGFGFEQAELPSVSLAFEPDTSEMKGDALPEVEISQLTNMEGTGTFDNVSRGAPPTATAILIALAAAGRNPADVTIPTIGSKAASGGEGSSGSGSSSSSSSTSSPTGGSGFGSDAARTGGTASASPSGVMVSQGVVSLPSSSATSGGTASSSVSDSGSADSTTTSSPTSDASTGIGTIMVQADDSGRGGGAAGSNLSP